jgi:hypothetical protein
VRGPANEKEYPMTTDTKPKPTWEQKLEAFAAMYGPFTWRWNEYRTFRHVEGLLEVFWPGIQSKLPPLIEIDDKPRCACCGSFRPMSMRYLTDRNGEKHLVGEECYLRLHELHHVTLPDFVSPIPQPQQ